ncbi:MAG: hydrogenase maturation nickel metallochaperone HypA [Acidobacteriia bacterium]|nr:hydrogenase maturation nickel metallochaperone HypA [Terriglobia bacterium]
MHELGIANSVLEAVQAEALRHPGAHVVKVGVRVGELAGVNPDSLAFGFEALTRGTEWERLALDVETCPRRHRCLACQTTFRVVDALFACPGCGAAQTECIGGDELELAFLEMEEP